MFSIVIGCTTSAPDGSSPRGYSRKLFSSIGSSILSSHLPISVILALISLGARLALPMRVAPEAIRGCLQPVIDSNISFGQLFLFYTLSTPFSSINFDGILKARDFVGTLVCKGPLRVTYI
jgi:hypothetical protein